MYKSIQQVVLALAVVVVLADAATAQNSTSSQWSQSWSSSSSSSWGTRADGTTFRNGQSRSNSQLRASQTTSNGFGSNTTTLNANRSTRAGFAQSNGPNGFQQSTFQDDRGNLSLTNQRRQQGLFGSVSDTRSLNAGFRNTRVTNAGFGPSGAFASDVRRNSGNVSVGRTINASNVFGQQLNVGATRSASFNNVQGNTAQLTSGGLIQNSFNNQNVNISGTNFANFIP